MKSTKLLLWFAMLINISALAQTKSVQQSEPANYSNNPEWIKMIDNPNTNYYEAVKAFDTYWKGKTKPEGEDDIINEHATRKERRDRERAEKLLSKMTPAERNEYDKLVYQCKRFETWKREVFPYVQEDGRILSQQERIEIWNKQQEEIKNQQPR